MTSRINQSTLGQDVPQVNARAKVLGRAQYAGDLKVAGMLHGAVLRSPYPHARIVAIDTSAALALPGVKAVLTGADAPRVMWGVHHKERRILAEGVVRFAGEEVAAVAAASEEIARDALDHIQVEYEELPAILTPEEALDEEAPGVHPGRNNVSHEIRFERGDADAGFASADLVHEATYTTHAQYPGYLEPMATVAALEPNGRLVVWTSTQSVTQARLRLAAALEMPISRIRVHQATTGGGFGGKLVEDANNLIAGLLARKTGKPVRLVNNRLEDFLAAPSSVPERITLKLGMTRAGLIVAKEVRIVADCGAYSGLAAEVMHVSAMRSDNMHRNPNVRSHATLVYTHTPPHGAFRGFGGSQMLFALNSHIHTMAEQLGLDPVAIHKLNAIGAGETSIHGWQIGSTGLKECIDQAIDAIGWEAKRAAPKGTGARRRGVGMAAAMHVSGNRTIGNWDGSTVVVKVNEDGRVFIHSGEADMGQGAMTMLSQVVAHELDIPLDHTHVVPPDTDTSPIAIGSLASRVTIAGGNAAIVAARMARDKLLALAATQLERPVEQLECANGTVRVIADPERSCTLAMLARLHVWRHGGEGLQVSGSWDARTQMHDDQVYGNIAPAYSFAAQAVEVEVDTETGQVTVLDSFVSDDCGKALNPLAIHGQTNGATVQAIGWALYEQLQLEGGRMANGNFADYTMATSDAVPMLRGGIVESNDPNGPYGAKGASETAILPGAPAIANAVYDAIGVRIRDLPITPEKVLAGLRELQGARDA
ncbi:xanthine dehydrogenase family protein molybdopterin-binding subunit [Variovorax ginsengisoli]|uniref:Xanthine dehydrogenase family protein molybdopterin-binding subunit n=1 Tax=Variovorax ginsengisoli TaxID=363844 RepID=A0ABT8SB37_9BURK|nr:xanthine dehydrogenase family protein molybdopterin-binding subunit [Variovorax ginsengisoli]MDN8616242.1 xanthine dehydrogenase family protein molybdopterin-binding subunit [Variovorax ginsengisoli]MDO1535412.1 xanthine dehydrogenase family protein molybdopterin-binding subunit [Variovorax ginsengisoli]